MNKKTILIAEDDHLIAEAYLFGLKKAGYNIIAANNGIEAIKQITEHKPDMVLLDLRMPKKDGFQVLEDLNKSGLIKNTNIIVTSNLDQEKDTEKCKKLGAKDFIVKANSSIEDIVKKIEKFLN